MIDAKKMMDIMKRYIDEHLHSRIDEYLLFIQSDRINKPLYNIL